LKPDSKNNDEEKEQAQKVFFGTTNPGFEIKTSELNVTLSFCPLKEINERGTISQESLQSSKLKYSHSFEQNDKNNNITLTYSTKLDNGAEVEIIQTLMKKKTTLKFEEEKEVEIEMEKNTVKYSYLIKNWPFKNEKNQLEFAQITTHQKMSNVQNNKPLKFSFSFISF
jgi:hypothetical protein